MNSDIHSLIPLKNSLQQSVKFQKISDEIFAVIKDIPNVSSLKADVELIQYVCSMIEHLCKKKYKLDKLLLLKYTLRRLMELTSEDEIVIDGIVNYLLNNKLVKAVAISKRSYAFVKSFLKSSV